MLFSISTRLEDPLYLDIAKTEYLRFNLSHMSKLLLGVLGGDGRWHNDIIARSKRTTLVHAPKKT